MWLELDGLGWPHPGLASVEMARRAGLASTSSLRRLTQAHAYGGSLSREGEQKLQGLLRSRL